MHLGKLRNGASLSRVGQQPDGFMGVKPAVTVKTYRIKIKARRKTFPFEAAPVIKG
jgi:hypothetical protein